MSWCCSEAKAPQEELNIQSVASDHAVQIEDAIPFTLQEEPKIEAATLPTLAKEPYRYEFIACVETDVAGQAMGLELDTTGEDAAMILKIDPGVVERYNKKASPDARIQVGDFIVAVNGARGTTRVMADARQVRTKLDLLIRRPAKFSVFLDKNGQSSSLGITTDYLPMGKSLLVKSINSGLIADWNRENPGKAVKVNDRIIEINGIAGDIEQFFKICKHASHIELVLVRL